MANREDSSDEGEGSQGASGLQSLLQLFATKLGFRQREEEQHEQVLEEVSFSGIANYIKGEKCHNIIVMTGAGVSTSAGIPDFRSPGSGLYDNLQKYNLPHPQAIFEISFFKENPEPFFALAKELYPGSFKPTPCHYFIRLLHEKGLLLRLYTQNIDTLDRIAGIPDEKLVEAHGTFHTSHCLNRSCRKGYTLEWMKEIIFKDEVPSCTECNSVVKPDIVFFGENLPEKFYSNLQKDFPKCDLAIIMGTSLAVQPFASLVDRIPKTAPRLLINKEKAGQVKEMQKSLLIRVIKKMLPKDSDMMQLLGLDGGLKFEAEDNYRDVAWLGLCDDGCYALAEALGWSEELKKLIESEHKRIDETNEISNSGKSKSSDKSSSASNEAEKTTTVKTTEASP